jgi:hypothetical protein
MSELANAKGIAEMVAPTMKLATKYMTPAI